MKISFREFLDLDKETQRQLGNMNANEELNKSVKNKKMMELETLLKSHDWYFSRGSHISWKKGEEELSKIRRLVDFIGKDGMKLYKTYGKKNGVMESENIYVLR